MDLHQFCCVTLENNDPLIDNVLYLQNYAEGWKDGKFEEKFDYRDCIDPPRYRQEEESGLYTGWFWDYSQFRAKSFKYVSIVIVVSTTIMSFFRCMSVQGKSTILKDLILNDMGDRVLLDRAEQVLHVYFGDENYWAARRSMRFSHRLVEVANEYREKHLNSNDEKDGTTRAQNWEEHHVIYHDHLLHILYSNNFRLLYSLPRVQPRAVRISACTCGGRTTRTPDGRTSPASRARPSRWLQSWPRSSWRE